MRNKLTGKRLTAFSLALALLLSLLAACSKPGNSQVEGKDASPAATGQASAGKAEDGGPMAFDLWLGWSATINNDSLIQQYWREQEPGVDVKLEATQGDVLTALNLRINTGGFKDAAAFNRSDTVKNALIQSGLIQPVEQYFEMPDKYPGLAAIPKPYLERMKDKDGHIWSIPTWFDQNPDDPWPGWSSVAWIVRSDIVEQTGMKLDDLATLEGVETFLRKAAGLKDDDGKSILPMSFLMDTNDTLGWSDENAVLSAFGVTTGGAGIEKRGDSFVFAYDDPNYKAAYQWLNRMYRDKLIDPEVVTNKKEQYQERNKAGRVALNVGSFWNISPSVWETLDGPTEPGWYYEVLPFPKVPGVEELGKNQVVNPHPGYDVYISNNTSNLDAILKFFDYTLQPKAEMQQVINEGPAGVYWDWADHELGKWRFIDENYEKDRNSGDPAQKSLVTPELYMLSSFSNDWYPWWNVADVDKQGAAKTTRFTEAIGKMGGVRTAHTYDMVPQKQGGLWEKYGPELDNVRKEFRAKLIMAKDDDAFEAAWNAFRDALEKRGHWSELKQEWQESYEAEVAAHGAY